MIKNNKNELQKPSAVVPPAKEAQSLSNVSLSVDKVKESWSSVFPPADEIQVSTSTVVPPMEEIQVLLVPEDDDLEPVPKKRRRFGSLFVIGLLMFMLLGILQVQTKSSDGMDKRVRRVVNCSRRKGGMQILPL